MTPSQALEQILPFAGHRFDCAHHGGYLDDNYHLQHLDCNCGVARAIQNALEALSDAEPLVGPGRAEEDTGNFVFEQDHL